MRTVTQTQVDLNQLRRLIARSDWKAALNAARLMLAKDGESPEVRFAATLAQEQVARGAALSECLAAYEQGRFETCVSLLEKLKSEWPAPDGIQNARFCGTFDGFTADIQRKADRLKEIAGQVATYRAEKRWNECCTLYGEAMRLQPSNPALLPELREVERYRARAIALRTLGGLAVLAAAVWLAVILRGRLTTQSVKSDLETRTSVARTTEGSFLPTGILTGATNEPVTGVVGRGSSGGLYVGCANDGEILLDGKAAGFCGTAVEGIAPGRHEVAVEAKGFRRVTTNVQIRADERTRITVQLARLQGLVNVVATWPGVATTDIKLPKAARLQIGDVVWCEPRFPVMTNLPAGSYAMSLRIPGFTVNGPTSVEIRDDETIETSFELQPRASSVVFVTNTPKPAEITEGNVPLGVSGTRISLTPFLPHTLHFSSDGYSNVVRTLTVQTAGAVYTNAIRIEMTLKAGT